MRILLISNMYPSKKNNIYGIFIKHIKDDLDKYEDVEHILCLMTSADSKISKLFKYILFNLKQFFFCLFSNVDIVYVHFPKRASLFSVFIAHLRKKKIVLNYHGTDIIGSSLVHKKNQFLIKISSKIVVPSQVFYISMLKKYKIDSDKVIISPSGGISDSFIHSDGYISDGPIGYVSRIVEEKGWKTLFKSYSEDGSHLPPLEYYGNGDDVKDLIKTIKNNKKISYNGASDYKDLPEVYRKFSLFIFPSERESLGLVGLEALASGIPVIGSCIGGITSYIKNGENGFLFESGNYVDLRKKIDLFYSLSLEKRIVMSENAKLTGVEYSTTKVVKKLHDNFVELLEE